MGCSSKFETQAQSFWKKTCAREVGKDFLDRKHNATMKEKTSDHPNPPLRNWVVLQFRAYWPVAAPYCWRRREGSQILSVLLVFQEGHKRVEGKREEKKSLRSRHNLLKKNIREKYSTCKSLVKKKEENHRTCQRLRKTALGMHLFIFCGNIGL